MSDFGSIPSGNWPAGMMPTGVFEPADINTVEAELRDIDDDFTSGRMNAFGTPATHEAIVKELRKISELELQVFIRTNSIIKATVGEDHGLQKVIFGSAPQSSSHADPQVQQQHQIASSSSAGQQDAATSMMMGFTDKAFDEFSRHFRLMETAFNVVGDNLRHMSKHLATLNETVGKVNAAGGAASMK